MRYIRFYGGNGYAGCDYEEFMKFEDDAVEQDFDGISYDLGCENAESFSHVAFGWDENPESEEYDTYMEDALGYCGWEEISEGEYNENLQ